MEHFWCYWSSRTVLLIGNKSPLIQSGYRKWGAACHILYTYSILISNLSHRKVLHHHMLSHVLSRSQRVHRGKTALNVHQHSLSFQDCSCSPLPGIPKTVEVMQAAALKAKCVRGIFRFRYALLACLTRSSFHSGFQRLQITRSDLHMYQPAGWAGLLGLVRNRAEIHNDQSPRLTE